MPQFERNEYCRFCGVVTSHTFVDNVPSPAEKLHHHTAICSICKLNTHENELNKESVVCLRCGRFQTNDPLIHNHTCLYCGYVLEGDEYLQAKGEASP